MNATRPGSRTAIAGAVEQAASLPRLRKRNRRKSRVDVLAEAETWLAVRKRRRAEAAKAECQGRHVPRASEGPKQCNACKKGLPVQVIYPGISVVRSTGEVFAEKGVFDSTDSGIFCVKQCYKDSKLTQNEKLEAKFRRASMRRALSAVVAKASATAVKHAQQKLKELGGQGPVIRQRLLQAAKVTYEYADQAKHTDKYMWEQRQLLAKALSLVTAKSSQGFCLDCVRQCVNAFGASRTP